MCKQNLHIYKTIVILITVSILLCIGTISPAAEQTDVYQYNNSILLKKEYLLEKGYPDKYLDKMPIEVINTIYQKLYGQNVEIDVIIDKNYSVSDGQIETFDMKDDMSLVVIVHKYYNSNNNITHIEVNTGAYWINPPMISQREAIAINWDSSMFSLQPNSLFTYVDALCYKCGRTSSVTDTHTLVEAVQGGIGYRTYMIRKCDACGESSSRNLRNYLFSYITLLPKYTIKKGSGITSNINVQYGHNMNPLGIFDVGFAIKGVNVDLTGKLVDKLAAVGLFQA